MKPFHLMTRPEIREALENRARLFAFRLHRRDHPDADEAEAHAYADRHWHAFREMDADLLSLQIADAERAAAPMN